MSLWLCRINFNRTQLHQDKLWVYLSGFPNVGVANSLLGETKAHNSNGRASVPGCDAPLVYTCPPLLSSFFAVPMWIRVCTWENLLFTHFSLHCQSYKWMLSALGWAGNQFNMCFPIIPLLSLLFSFSKNYKHVVLKVLQSWWFLTSFAPNLCLYFLSLHWLFP